MFFSLYDELVDNKQHCYYFQTNCMLEDIEPHDLSFVYNILKIKTHYGNKPDLHPSNSHEVGFHLNYMSPWCSNVLSIFNKNNINFINRIERTTLVHKKIFDPSRLDLKMHKIYRTPILSFDVEVERTFNEIIDINKLEQFSNDNNLGFDKDDITYYTNLFKNNMNRNPSSMELVDLAQSNSEHSRHWFFNGIMNIGMFRETKTLMDYIKEPLECNKNNSIIAFKDNASAISTSAFVIDLLPSHPHEASPYELVSVKYYPTLNAETHNFPTGISPFPGAATGVGGRIRDTHAIGRGGIISAGIAGYCVGNLFMSESYHPWEKTDQKMQKINGTKMLLEASDGASDYGNKFGEPLVAGFCRSFGMNVFQLHLENNTRYEEIQHFEYIKPIMFSAGIGKIPEQSLEKKEGKPGMLIYKIGGPAYRIGIGGGSASSRQQDASIDDLNSVQRGDPEMENRMNRFVKVCSEMLDNNPIVKIHDQGAGGMANVTKEIIEPYGSTINIEKVILGDRTMTPFEIWNAEYQEQSTILIENNIKTVHLIEDIAARENVPLTCIGSLEETDKITVVNHKGEKYVDLNLSDVLTTKRRKEYHLKKRDTIFTELNVPTQQHQNALFLENIENIFSLVSVGSKSFLTLKVDRTVGGLVAQQQCVGPLDIPLCDYGMVKHTFYSDLATITAVGEQPVKGIIDPLAMVGMSIGEMLTNIIWGVIDDITYIKCSGNWMWPNCDPYEQYLLYNCVKEVSLIMRELGIAIDGGKDSLSMNVKTEDNKIIKSPRSFVVTGYAEVPDYKHRVTPDFKKAGNRILYINLSRNYFRLGGSAYAQTQNNLGNRFQIPKFENRTYFVEVFKQIQNLIKEEIILSGHDVSDGGIITTILEMCFGGNYGCELDINCHVSLYEFMFSEELGLIIEVKEEYVKYVVSLLETFAPIYDLGKVVDKNSVYIKYNDDIVLHKEMTFMRELWEATSLKLIERQFGKDYADKHRNKITSYQHQRYDDFKYDMSSLKIIKRPPVAILRDEGTTGDREMAAAFYTAGFEPWDITKEEYNNLSHHKFPITAICGGFTYSDVLGAGVGLKTGLNLTGYKLGICNGCQTVLDMEVNDSNRLESDMVWVEGNSGLLYDIKGRHKCIMVNKTGKLKENPTIMVGDKPVGQERNDGLFLMPHIERMITHERYESGWIQVFINFHRLI